MNEREFLIDFFLLKMVFILEVILNRFNRYISFKKDRFNEWLLASIVWSCISVRLRRMTSFN